MSSTRSLRISTAVCVIMSTLCLPPAHGEDWQATASIGGTLNDVAFLSATRVVTVGDDSAILLSVDGGVTWFEVGPLVAGPHLNAVAFEGPKGVAVGDAGLIMYSDDGGENWGDVSVPTRPENLNAVAIDGTTVIAVGDGLSTGALVDRYFTVVRSTDGGASFNAIDGGFFGALTQKPLLDVVFVDANTLVAVGAKSGGNTTVLRSSDKGERWDDVLTFNNPPNKDLNSLAVSGATVVAVGDKSGSGVAIYRSVDWGVTWDVPNSFPAGAPNNQPLTDMLFVDATTVVAVGNEKSGGAGYRILISGNSGDDWGEPTLPAGSANLTSLVAGNGLLLAGGDSGTILASIDDGATWTADSTYTAVDILDVDIINPSIAVGSGGLVFLRGAAAGVGSALSVSGYLGSNRRGGQFSVTAPFGFEWLFGLLVLGCALHRLR
ncbi:WD40/YVTN/BNR-like repeat-containing protein [Candidatus Latescibacterota bacterium]